MKMPQAVDRHSCSTQIRFNTITNFDLDDDFLQFDAGMFSADTAAAVLDAAHDHNGNLVIDVHAGHLTIVGITSADLAAHTSDIIFV